MRNRRFNPRICKRCDSKSKRRLLRIAVSIHASVKDATEKWAEAYTHVRVSIHASVKDATVRLFPRLLRSMFQSTHL